MKRLELIRQFEFDSAHFLPNCEGKCRQIHGHRYKLEVSVTIKDFGAGVDAEIDMGVVKEIINKKVIDRLDHNCLNELISNPTMENISLWVLKEIEDDFLGLNVKIASIRLWETPNNSAVLFN